MIIIYIEEDLQATRKRLRILKHALDPITIKSMRQRRIVLTSDLIFYVINKSELDKIRGLQTLAVFINCDLDPYDRAGIASMVRGR